MDKSKSRDSRLQKTYNISTDDYLEMFNEQNGSCAICNIDYSFSRKVMHVDHDHLTKKVRNLLCNHCNLGLGQFRDDPNLLEKAAKYIRSHRR
jgi:hypothetical protein